MKYCSKCGHELLDEAIVCVHCGCMIRNNIGKEKQTIDDPRKSLAILSFIYWIMLVIIFILLGASLANGTGKFFCSDYAPYGNVYCTGDVPFIANEDTSIAAMVFASFSFVMAIANVVCACAGRYAFKEKLFSVLKIIISIGVIILAGIMIG